MLLSSFPTPSSDVGISGLRRLRLDDSYQLVLRCLTCVRIAVPVDREDGVPDARHGHAVRGTVRAGRVVYRGFTLQIMLLSRRFPTVNNLRGDTEIGIARENIKIAKHLTFYYDEISHF